jgi:hypothetical protein
MSVAISRLEPAALGPLKRSQLSDDPFFFFFDLLSSDELMSPREDALNTKHR